MDLEQNKYMRYMNMNIHILLVDKEMALNL